MVSLTKLKGKKYAGGQKYASRLVIFCNNFFELLREIIHSLGSLCLLFIARRFAHKFLKHQARIRISALPQTFMNSLAFVRNSNISHGTVGRKTGFWSVIYGFESQHSPVVFNLKNSFQIWGQFFSLLLSEWILSANFELVLFETKSWLL